jgi:hypothetical protein
LIIAFKENVMDYVYQLKLKKASQYAMENFTYDEYVIFLDQYLSEISTANYQMTTK